MKKLNLASLSHLIQTESQAYEYVERLRWDTTPICAHCESTEVALIVPKNGSSRKTAGGSMSERRVWRCRLCEKQFSAITNTAMHATKVPVRTWLLVIFEMCASKNGMSAREVERKYGLTPRTAWHMTHRIRSMMAGPGPLATMTGTIVSDETWVGPTPKWMHRSERPLKGSGFHTPTKKVPVLSLVNNETGEIRSRVVADVTSHTLRKAITEHVDMARSVLWTDEARQYMEIGEEFIDHQAVNHAEEEWVDAVTGATTNRLEGFFAQLKRSLDGTHHHVSRKHLGRYLNEFDYRYSTCGMSDEERMADLATQMEGRLSLTRLIGS